MHSYILHACPPQLALVVLLVAGIHFIEAYGLNPAIYSAHLKLHPLLVLSVLVIAEHSLGVWGLLLAGAHPYHFALVSLAPSPTLSVAACYSWHSRWQLLHFLPLHS